MVDISYDPSPPSFTDPADLGRYTYDELQRIRDAINQIMNLSPSILDISRGLVPGHSQINKFGRNIDVDTAAEEDIWDGGGTYTFSTTADITHVVSSNAGDTFTFTVVGLDTNWEEVVQDATLTGTTAVALTTPLIRVYRMFNPSASAALGNVQCGVGTTTGSFLAANLRAQITLGFEQTLMAIYTIPAGKTGYATNFWGNINRTGASASVDTTVKVRNFEGVFRALLTTGLITSATSLFQRDWNPYPKLLEKTDVKVSSISSTNNSDVSAGFDIILVDNSVGG